ncbi:MAG: hypothetical protein SWZ49_25945 [Cyanobacteriota bacterium]|nr:hypothetical protein [Cyanobacteriota bacterium]
MKIKGIKRGKTIELLESVNSIPDGTEIIVQLEVESNLESQTTQSLTDEERLTKLNQLFGAWKNQPDLMETFEEIDKERHSYKGRQLDTIENQDNE